MSDAQAAMKEYDAIVLGAGIVGISTALCLLSEGRSVALVDRRGPAEETSYGNAGIIQPEGIGRFAFPRTIAELAKYATNQSTKAHVQVWAVPRLLPNLIRYWHQSSPQRMEQSIRAMWALVDGSLSCYENLMERAGVASLLRHTGYLKIFRDARAVEAAIEEEKRLNEPLGVPYKVIDAAGLKELEPGIVGDFAGGIFFPGHASVGDPGQVGAAYAADFARRGGTILVGDAFQLSKQDGRWSLSTSTGLIRSSEVVIALGPWADVLLRRLGLRIPLGVKRGYHMHYALGRHGLRRPVHDGDYGYVVSQMTRGIRLTTGAEFAMLDARPTPVQLDRVEPIARGSFPLGGRLDAKPWVGGRPYLPDLLPMIGRVPHRAGLWTNFGHHHLGFTSAPVSARLLVEMMMGRKPFVDPAPYRPERFLRSR